MFVHETVLLQETLTALQPADGGTFIDCTVGGGGHTEQLLRASAPTGRVLGLDQDDAALAAANLRLHEFTDRLELVRTNFRHIESVARSTDFFPVDGIVFDLGVSSPQFDVTERGFTYREDGPLDMRMDRRQVVTAAHLLAELPEDELAQIFFQYGEERFARRIAANIVERRSQKPLTTTKELAEIVKESIPAATRRTGPHPARRTFQALRMAVNEELKALEEGVRGAFQVLSSGGRLAVISFHSLEDRMVKSLFREFAEGCICPPDFPVCRCGRQPMAKLVPRKAIVPSEREVAENPRARSAKLRVLEKL